MILDTSPSTLALCLNPSGYTFFRCYEIPTAQRLTAVSL